MARARTPLIKPRSQGGTFYTFGSALEDVGLNINELKHKVSLSHYILLDIPAFTISNFSSNDSSLNKGDYEFAQNLQNYALNMETVLRNQKTYNFAESLTVSERVFWKWLQRNGVISFAKDTDENGNETGYYIDSSTFTSSSVIKGFGAITAGAQRTDAYGIYNETFVQIPSSYGQMKVLLKPVYDKNYHISSDNYVADSSTGLIENITEDEVGEDGVTLYTGLSGKAIYDNEENKSYMVSSEAEELCAEFSLSELRKYYDDETLSYDEIGIGTSEKIRPNNVGGDYKFNAVLVYYSIYDPTNKNVLATNAYGLLILDSAQNLGNGEYKFTSLDKKQSNEGDTGNSYAFRLNIKTSSVYNGDVQVEDNSTPGYEMSEEFNDAIRNLAVAVETLRSNANVISVIANQNTAIKQLVIKSLDSIDDIQKDINNLKSGKLKEFKVSNLLAETAAINDVLAAVKFVTDDGVIHGKIDGDVLSYNQIESKYVTTDTLKATNLGVDAVSMLNTVLPFTYKGEQYAKITSNGVFSNHSLFMRNTVADASVEDIDVNTAGEIVSKIDTGVGYIRIPSLSDSTTANVHFTKLVNSITSNYSYIDTLSLLSILITVVKEVYSYVNIIKDFKIDSSTGATDFSALITDLSVCKEIASSAEDKYTAMDLAVKNITSEINNIKTNYKEDIINSVNNKLSLLTDTISTANSAAAAASTTANELSDKVASLDETVNRVNRELEGIVGLIRQIES